MKGPVDEIEVRMQGTVETTDLAGVLRGHRQQFFAVGKPVDKEQVLAFVQRMVRGCMV